MAHRRNSSLPRYHIQHLQEAEAARPSFFFPPSPLKKAAVIFAASLILSVTIMIVFELTAKRHLSQLRSLHHRMPSNGSSRNVYGVFERPEWNEGLWNIVASSPDASTSPRPRLRDSPYLVVIVASAPCNFRRRAAIRNSWYRLQTSKDLLTVFLVGQTINRDLANRVLLEAGVERDVLVGSYRDAYRNLTLKTVHGLLWSHETLKPKYVLKTDDDCFVNLKILSRLLRENADVVRTDRPLYVGNVRWESRVIRDPSNRWYVPERALGATLYPPYGSGAGYLLDGEALSRFVDVAKYVKPFPNEDAYVGVVLRTANVRPLQSARFATRSAGLWICNFLYLVVVHGVSAGEQGLFADKVVAAEKQCRGAEIDTDWN